MHRVERNHRVELNHRVKMNPRVGGNRVEMNRVEMNRETRLGICICSRFYFISKRS